MPAKPTTAKKKRSQQKAVENEASNASGATSTGPGGAFAPPGLVRSFSHDDGRRYGLEVDGCRVYEQWTLAKGKGQASTSIRDTAVEAHAFALAKARELTQKGFVEGTPREGHRYDRDAELIAVFHSDVDFAGERRHDFQPVAGRSHVHTTQNVSVAQWLVTSDDRRRGILLRALVWQSAMKEGERHAVAEALTAELVRRRAELLADETTPLRKLVLPSPVGRFTHLVVVSPEVASVTVSRDVSYENPAIARSVFVAFPAFDCEATGSETVSVALARIEGRGAIRTNAWDRAPHPVMDLAIVKKAGDAPRFLVHPPSEIQKLFSAAALQKLAGAELHARNHAGEVRVLARGEAPPAIADLRRFFGFAD